MLLTGSLLSGSQSCPASGPVSASRCSHTVSNLLLVSCRGASLGPPTARSRDPGKDCTCRSPFPRKGGGVGPEGCKHHLVQNLFSFAVSELHSTSAKSGSIPFFTQGGLESEGPGISVASPCRALFQVPGSSPSHWGGDLGLGAQQGCKGTFADSDMSLQSPERGGCCLPHPHPYGHILLQRGRGPLPACLP